jgi:hypothetical protein
VPEMSRVNQSGGWLSGVVAALALGSASPALAQLPTDPIPPAYPVAPVQPVPMPPLPPPLGPARSFVVAQPPGTAQPVPPGAPPGGPSVPLPPGMVQSPPPGTRPLAELHRITGSAPPGGTMGNSAVEYNPNAPTLPDYTELGVSLPNASQGYGATQAMIRRLQTGGTPEVYDLFPHWRAGWSKGFVIAPVDPQKTPFELRINGTFQARYTGFARDSEFFINSSGQAIPVHNRNDVQFPRALLSISGYAYDENLTYDLWLGASTGSESVMLFLPALGYRVCKEFYPRVGVGRVPFGSEFIIADFTTQLVDRSMATAFFAGDFAIGLWATGQLTEKFGYWTMLANGLQTYAIDFQQLDNQFIFGHANIWDPIGKYGTFISDLEYHEDPAVRMVQSYLWAPERGQPTGQPFQEAIFPRLSDGQFVTNPGALAPGVTVNSFNQYGLAQSVQFKYRGFSFFGEWIGQWFQGFRTTGGNLPKENRNIFNNGFTAQSGYFVVPKRFEVLARTSHVFGPQGNGSEYSVGCNYFIKGNPFNKISMDFQRVHNVPSFQEFNGYVPGQSGFIGRLQWELGF